MDCRFKTYPSILLYTLYKNVTEKTRKDKHMFSNIIHL